MKKIIPTIVLGVALFGAQMPQAEARGGDCAVGAVLGGIVAGAVIADAFRTQPVYYSPPAYCPPPAPLYYQPAPAYCPPPAPVVVYRQPTPVVVYREPVVRFGFGYVRAWGRDSGRGHGHCR